jgi:hypothetical protein
MASLALFEGVGSEALRVDARRPIELDASPELIAAIDEVGAEAVSLWAEATDRPEELVRQQPGSCFEVSSIMCELLAVRGVANRLMEYRKGPGAHYFLETQNGDPYKELFADGTWQQMLFDTKPDYSSQPGVLIVPSFQPVQALAAHGISHRWLPFWTEGHRSARNWRELPPNSALRRVIAGSLGIS